MSATPIDDARQGRERHHDLAESIDRGRADADTGSRTILVRATQTVSPPGFVRCKLVTPSGQPQVGGSVTLNVKKATIVVASVGSAPMPTTKNLLAHDLGGLWAVQYDG